MSQTEKVPGPDYDQAYGRRRIYLARIPLQCARRSAQQQSLGTNSLTLGANATAGFTATNSVALGAGSVANEANVVSIGVAGSERRIVNVAEPLAQTDAANRQCVDDARAEREWTRRASRTI